MRAELREALKYPPNLEACPALTATELSEFKPVNNMTWKERARLMASTKIKMPANA
jgi:hypothetical protein